MNKRIFRLVLLFGALCCLLPSARAQTSDIEIERQSDGTYFAACHMPGLGRLTIRQLENGEFDLYINSPQESEKLEPIKGQRQVTVAFELENLALISNALVLVVPDQEISLPGFRFDRLCLYYPAWQKQKGRHEASLYFSDDSGETRVLELSSPEYMKLLATRDIEKIHVNVGLQTVCVLELTAPTAATFRAMCREIGDRIDDHSFYGETASSDGSGASGPSDADAQNKLGNRYYKGDGVKQDDKQAVYWWRKAAEQGHVKGQINLGGCYYYGIGVAQDYGQAALWYRKAAEQGDADAQYQLGYCYYKGIGVTENRELAVSWFRKALEQGHMKAHLMLEEMGIQ